MTQMSTSILVLQKVCDHAKYLYIFVVNKKSIGIFSKKTSKDVFKNAKGYKKDAMSQITKSNI